VTSVAKGGGTRSFEVAKALPMAVLRCTDSTFQWKDHFEGPSGTNFAVRCPAKCFSQVKKKEDAGGTLVWGNAQEGYTDDSSICLAAINAGILNDA